MESQLELARPNIQEAGGAPPVQETVRRSAREKQPPPHLNDYIRQMSFMISTICTTLYSLIVILVSLSLRLFLCKDNIKYISYSCTLHSISSNDCISKEGRYVVIFTYRGRIDLSDNTVFSLVLDEACSRRVNRKSNEATMARTVRRLTSS